MLITFPTLCHCNKKHCIYCRKVSPQVVDPLDPTVKPSTWYEPITLLLCNKLQRGDMRLCSKKAIAVEHDPHTGYTGVNRCKAHLPKNISIHGKDY